MLRDLPNAPSLLFPHQLTNRAYIYSIRQQTCCGCCGVIVFKNNYCRQTYNLDTPFGMIRGVNHNGDESKYEYNALGTLVGRETITATGTHTNDFVIDYTSFVPTILMESTSDDIIKRHTYGNGLSRISTTLTQGNHTETFFIQNDRLGSGTLATNADGVRVGHTELNEWGLPLDKILPTFNGNHVDILNTFTNHTYDDVLGLYFAQQRTMCPTTKRFISPDPYWHPGNMLDSNETLRQFLNPYTYVLNNPLKYTDPTGLKLAIEGTEAQISRFIRELNLLTRDTVILNGDPELIRGRANRPRATDIFRVYVGVDEVHIPEGSERSITVHRFWGDGEQSTHYYHVFGCFNTKSLHGGTELLRDVIGHERTTTISFKKGDDGTARPASAMHVNYDFEIDRVRSGQNSSDSRDSAMHIHRGTRCLWGSAKAQATPEQKHPQRVRLILYFM